MYSFLSVVFKKPEEKWRCPLCNCFVGGLSSLVIDGFFTEVLASPASAKVTDVQFLHVNGTIEWKPIVKEHTLLQIISSAVSCKKKIKKSRMIEVIDLTNSDDEENTPSSQVVSIKKEPSSQTSSNHDSDSLLTPAVTLPVDPRIVFLD